MTRIARALSAFVGWLVGRPPSRKRAVWLRWSWRVILAIGLGYVFLYGPGIRLWPAAPGLDRVGDESITVHYQARIEPQAQRAVVAVREAQQAVLEFWGRPGEHGFPFAIDLYLCATRSRYRHLILNNAMASASGNDVIMDVRFPEEARARFLRHELAHLYVVHEYGWLRSRMHTPAWLDEGIATVVQASEWNDEDGLAHAAARTRELASLASTNNVLEWLGAVFGGGDRAGAQYAYVRAFTEVLLASHGRDAVLGYLREATLSGDHEQSFENAFGTSLAEAEREWVAAAKERGVLPAELKLVDRGVPAPLAAKFLIAAAFLVALVLWAFRQLCRVLRAVRGLLGGRRSGEETTTRTSW